MHILAKTIAAVCLTTGLFTDNASRQPFTLNFETGAQPAANEPKRIAPKIQVAILLDVSNSMDGLIEQAKAQLWNMVSVMGKIRCNEDVTPSIEIALYEYGRPSNSEASGYVKRIMPFTTDLDELSQNLFRLKTYGGSEHCGHVMYTSLSELPWDPSSSSYKVIFIAGNEDFLQGKISWTKACELAKQKGVVINTIYCGDKQQGIREHWNLGGECGTGSYTNINHYAQIEDITTPYDQELFALNEQLNNTYIAYGSQGAASYEKQRNTDKMNYAMNKSAAAKRVAVKGKKQLYQNTSWDLVDAAATDSTVIGKVEMKTLPPSLQNKSRAELQQIVKVKTKERTEIQQQIAAVNAKREAWIKAEKAKNASGNNQPTLETEVERIIKVQAKRYNMRIE